MKRLLIIPSILIILVALAACQTPRPTPAPAATTRPPANTPVAIQTTPTATTAPPLESTTEPTQAPTAEATQAPAATPTQAPTQAPTSAPTETQAPPPSARDIYVSSEDGLNLRANSDATSSLLRTLAYGTHLSAIGQPTEPDIRGIAWQNVRTDDGQAGWVAAQFLSSTNPQAAPPTPALGASSTSVVTPIGEAGYVYVASSGGLNMRADHSVSSLLVAMLANGQRLQTNGLGFGPDTEAIIWLNVKTEDAVEGWVARRFITYQVPSVAPAPPPANVPDAVAEILRRTNEFRQQNGVAPVVLNDDLDRIALEHSQYMAQNGITHTGAGGLSAKQRIANAGYGAGRPTENIYGGEASIDDAWSYWSTDPPHRDVLLNSFNTVVGIGVFKTGRSTYYTMDFGKPAE